MGRAWGRIPFAHKRRSFRSDGTFADLAHMAAVVALDAVAFAAKAVDHLGCDRGLIHFTPLFGDNFAQVIVVFYGGEACITRFTI